VVEDFWTSTTGDYWRAADSAYLIPAAIRRQRAKSIDPPLRTPSSTQTRVTLQ
jgi:hypothetical protein